MPSGQLRLSVRLAARLFPKRPNSVRGSCGYTLLQLEGSEGFRDVIGAGMRWLPGDHFSLGRPLHAIEVHAQFVAGLGRALIDALPGDLHLSVPDLGVAIDAGLDFEAGVPEPAAFG